MPEFDDVILPDDYEAPPQAEEAQEQEPAEEQAAPEVEDTKPTEEQATPEAETPAEQKFKLKYNHEDVELPIDEVTSLAQKGLNYEKAVERAKQEARDAYIAEQGHTWNGKPITTEAEYKQAVAEQELIEKYKDRDLPDEVIQEIMESRRDREERQREKAEREEQAQKDAMLNDFLDYFKGVNERDFDANKDTIPKEVREAVNAGQPLKVAYMEYHNRELRSQLKIAKQNEENTKKAPIGSVTAHGGKSVEPEDDFLRGFNSIE